jgi:hypothetical protein
MPKEYEYHEGKQVQENFEHGMKALFQVPCSQGCCEREKKPLKS